ncbi:hypothetical protein MYX64_12010, partial [Nitrospinae bacterium AH_259_B05_G02_I21]|nr:hypothetical protein [Nitrospinae bacterium AH_259_B05_G02_I21]
MRILLAGLDHPVDEHHAGCGAGPAGPDEHGPGGPGGMRDLEKRDLGGRADPRRKRPGIGPNEVVH